MTLKNRFLSVIGSFGLLLVFCTGCNNKSQTEEATPKETMSLSAADTTQVINLMQQYFDHLMKKDFEGAMSMISQLRNDSLEKMSPELEKHYQIGMKIVSPIRYDLETLVFEDEHDCLVKYSAVLFDKEDASDNRPNKMFFVVKPVRINGEWHLTVADDDDLNTRDSNIDKQ